MKLKYIILVVTLLLPVLTEAVCPTQKTTLFFANGVDTKYEDANKSKTVLRNEILKKGVSKDCIVFNTSYNSNELLFLDFLEAGLQRAGEVEGRVESFWEFYLRAKGVFGSSESFFDQSITDLFALSNLYIQSGKYVLGNQLEEHLKGYRKLLLRGERIILLGHSQGNLYVNEAWKRINLDDRENVKVIAVATPSANVGEYGVEPYTTLYKDSLAATAFVAIGALPPNTPMLEECADELLGLIPAAWLCHGFKEAYMFGNEPREQILNDIIDALPKDKAKNSKIQGHIYFPFNSVPAAGALIKLYNASGTLVAQTTSNENGSYDLMVAECLKCYLSAHKYVTGHTFYGDYFNLDVINGKTYTLDIIVSLVVLF